MCRMNRWLGSASTTTFANFDSYLPPLAINLTGATNLQLVNTIDLRPLLRQPDWRQLQDTASVFHLEHEPAAQRRLQDTYEEPEQINDGENDPMEETGAASRYLDVKILDGIKWWLMKCGFLSRAACAYRELRSYMLIFVTCNMNQSLVNRFESNHIRRHSLGLDALGWTRNVRDRQDNRLDWNNHENRLPHESEEVKVKLLQSLRVNRLINSVLVTSHILLLTISAKWSSPFVRDFYQFLNLTPVEVTSDLLPTQESTSWINSYSYYLLTVTLIDLLGSIHWYHSKDRFKVEIIGNLRNFAFIENQVSWIKWTLLILTSPRHTYQVAYASVLIALGPFGGSTGLLVGLFNSLIQGMSHIYNIYRIGSYLRIIETGSQHSGELDANNNNIIRDNLIDRRTGQICELRPGGNRGGWSNWPVELSACDCEFTESLRFRLEHILMLLQVVGVKLTIFTLLVYIDTLSSVRRVEGFLSLFCLLQAFLAVHFYYDKYLARYMEFRPKQATC